MSKLDSALDRMDCAYNRLKPEQGQQGRNNARTKFLTALRDARKALDEEYPVIRKQRKRKRKTRHPRQLGWKPITPAKRRDLLLAGVHERRFRKGSLKKGEPGLWWTEPWIRRAVDAGMQPKRIARASKNGKERKRLDATLRLGASRG